MSRIDILIQHPKRTLGVLALVLAAVGVAVGSGATFSASSANPSNTFTAGTLTMSNSADNSAILSVGSSPGWKPGDSTSGTVDIKNTGSLAGTFSLNRSALSDTNPNDTPSGPSPAPADRQDGRVVVGVGHGQRPSGERVAGVGARGREVRAGSNRDSNRDQDQSEHAKRALWMNE